MKQGQIKVSDERIKELFNEGETLHNSAARLNMSPITLWRRAKKIGIKFSNLKRLTWNKIELEEILEGKHPSYQTLKLKKRLIEQAIKNNICEECGINEWNGKSISMQLDHIDGNPHNHKLMNLRMLCPNCHSQTETYWGKNKEC
jgi:hypothetical protein